MKRMDFVGARSAIVLVVAALAGAAGNSFAQGARSLSFGSAGVAAFNAGAADQWNDVRIQADGRIVVAGGGFVGRYLSNGAPDAAFNRSGFVNVPVNTAKTVAIQSDGKLLVGGDASSAVQTIDGILLTQPAGTSADINIVRLNVDGSLDGSFGVGGVVRTDLSAGGIDTVERIITFPTGKFWAIGASSSNRGISATNWAIVAYNGDGTLDTGFGTAGRVQVDFGLALSAFAQDALVQGDKVVIVGTSGRNFVAARFDAGGQLDTTFGTNGLTQIADATNLPNVSYRPTAVVAQPDGKLFVHGNLTFFDSDPGDVSPPLLHGVRLTANGQVDPTFTAFPNFGFIAGAASGSGISNGRVVLSVGGFRLIRLNDNGSVDTTFGENGIFTPRSSNFYRSENLAVQPGGGILVAGSIIAGNQNGLLLDASLIRVVPTGAPGPVLLPPAAPTNLAATNVAARSVTLTWRDNANNETSFVVERSTNARFTNAVQIATLGANVTTFTDNTVAARTTYTYRVTARNAQGSASSSTVAVTTPRR